MEQMFNRNVKLMNLMNLIDLINFIESKPR